MPYLYFQLFQRLISRNKQCFFPSDFSVPGAPPDALLLVSDVVLVRDLLALCTTIGLETSQKSGAQLWPLWKIQPPLPPDCISGRSVMRGKARSTETPLGK